MAWYSCILHFYTSTLLQLKLLKCVINIFGRLVFRTVKNTNHYSIVWVMGRWKGKMGNFEFFCPKTFAKIFIWSENSWQVHFACGSKLFFCVFVGNRRCYFSWFVKYIRETKRFYSCIPITHVPLIQTMHATCLHPHNPLSPQNPAFLLFLLVMFGFSNKNTLVVCLWVQNFPPFIQSLFKISIGEIFDEWWQLEWWSIVFKPFGFRQLSVIDDEIVERNLWSFVKNGWTFQKYKL